MMGNIRVSGYISYGLWKPFLKNERRVSVLNLSKSKVGREFGNHNNVSMTKEFSGFVSAMFGVGKQRVKLMRFERNDGMYNIVVVGNKTEDVRLTIKRYSVKFMNEVSSSANAASSVSHSFANLICDLATVSNYDSKLNEVHIQLRCDADIAQTLIDGFKAINLSAHATDASWNEVSILKTEDSPFVEAEEPAPKSIERNRNFFIVEPDVNAAFTAANHMRNVVGVGKVLLTGPSGFGKTTAAKMAAEKLGYKFVKVDCATLTEPNDIVHTVSFRNGETVFDKTPFVKAIESGKHVILLDELNRAYPNVLNTLMPILDDTRQITVGTEVYKVADDIIFVATMNVGQQYVGTFNYDAALVNRFPASARVGALSGEEESLILYHHSDLSLEMASEVVGFLREIRKTLTTSILDFSPRTAKAIGVNMGCGLGVHAATRTVLQAVATDEEWKEIVDVLQRRGFSYSKPNNLMF